MAELFPYLLHHIRTQVSLLGTPLSFWIPSETWALLFNCTSVQDEPPGTFQWVMFSHVNYLTCRSCHLLIGSMEFFQRFGPQRTLETLKILYAVVQTRKGTLIQPLAAYWSYVADLLSFVAFWYQSKAWILIPRASLAADPKNMPGIQDRVYFGCFCQWGLCQPNLVLHLNQTCWEFSISSSLLKARLQSTVLSRVMCLSCRFISHIEESLGWR